MLAAHRDQENLVHAHQASAKQQPKTPGPRYPKTPLGRFAKNDENAPTAFGGKNNLAGTIKRPTAQKQALATPLGTQSRAPLGNKTTNAKARPNQSANGKVKPNEASQLRPGTQRPKIRQPEAAASKLEVQSDKQTTNKDEEPEYAPLAPTPLPYQSDVLPEGGLTFRGLKKEYLLKGYYENFYNPIDANGISRLDKAFDDEMKSALDKAVEQHDREFEALDWGVHEAEERKADAELRNPSSKVGTQRTKVSASSDRAPHTLSSRRAASALAIRSDNRSTSALSSRVTPSARPAAQPRMIKSSAIEPPGTTTGEAASRTTIGYSKGRTASSIMRPHHQTSKSLTRPPARQTSDNSWDLTLTPARARLGFREQSPLKSTERPQFTSIFYDDEDEDDSEPVTLGGPAMDSDDDEEFELKLDI
ncbi:hypothetical protein ISF_04079 [Cordyceps fumosorosea ARSEF 2679]|uniref:Uncharacterized protein n=1 Tax=Cordyceps fumosorosea (strain ARSEF 2679) TaxID=1081104 RepID=A0A167YEN2_CORFA|nr:hypothetical protein ISF_04079 [Cordyceps fumosorosea ARSEF 2679]OAA66241.1 hypothetical protein ISF_04079 [Cordyceps fumosorosea ARSEF 2679]